MGNQDNIALRLAYFPKCEAHGFRERVEEPAAAPLLISRNPFSATIPADEEAQSR